MSIAITTKKNIYCFKAGYEKNFLYGKGIKWIELMILQWILPGGIMHGYSKPHRKTLSQKFRAVEKMANDLMNSRVHQSGTTDEPLPLWMNAFRDYLDIPAENPSTRVFQQRQAQRREVVIRSLIGQ